MWVDYRGSLSTVYNDGEISTCGWIIDVHSVQSTIMGGDVEVQNIAGRTTGRATHCDVV